MKRKILAAFTACVMAIGMLPGMALADETGNIEYSTDGGTEWQPGDFQKFCDDNMFQKNSIKVRLTDDVTINSSSTTLYGPSTPNEYSWEIDGDGHTITLGSNASMLFTLDRNCNMTLKNVTVDGGAVWSADESGVRTDSNAGNTKSGAMIRIKGDSTLTLENGAVLQNRNETTDSSAAVYVGESSGTPSNTGHLVMKDGSAIKDNHASDGAAVFIYDADSTFVMDGGEISGNAAKSASGVQVAAGSFEMNGGTISNNISETTGGGVAVGGTTGQAATTGAFVMNNGEISGNSAREGGGVAVANGTAEINGGTITGNKVDTNGGGVLVFSGNFAAGGEAEGNLTTLSGNPVITGNTNENGQANNVYLYEGKTIAVSEPLTEGAEIGVSTKAEPTEDAPVAITGSNSDDYSKDFSSDNSNYWVRNDSESGNTLQLTKKKSTVEGLSVESDNLDEVAEAEKVDRFVMDLKTTTANDNADAAAAIKEKAAADPEASGAPSQFDWFDVSLTAYDSDGKATAKTETTTAVTYTISYDSKIKDIKGVYRYHEGEVTSLPDSESEHSDGEYYEVDDKVGTVTIHMNKFSTLAVEYTYEPLEDENEIAESVTLSFDNGKDRPGEYDGNPDKYDIRLTAEDGKYINRYMSAELTLEVDGEYVITPRDDGSVVDLGEVEIDSKTCHKWGFHMDGINNPYVTGKEVTIGYIEFLGYGPYKATVVKNGTNVVRTAERDDNIVDTYSAADGVESNKLNIKSVHDVESDNVVVDGTKDMKTVPVQINVMFPNKLGSNAVFSTADYTNMKITAKGGAELVDGAAKYYERYASLGSDIDEGGKAGVYTDAEMTTSKSKEESVAKANFTYNTTGGTVVAEAAATANGYVVKLNVPEGRLSLTFEGKGYRKYSVDAVIKSETDEDGETVTHVINVWNNVMDNGTIVTTSDGFDPVELPVTFLAGDIVMDNTINLYDLSAAVAYFGKNGDTTAEMSDYARYDLNRDGSVDSKDIAMVLVSWGY